MRPARLFMTLALAAFAGTAHGADAPAPAAPAPAAVFPAHGSLYASVTAARHTPDSARGLADGVHGAFALGFRFTPRLSLELGGGRTETALGAADVDIDTLRQDSVWHFDTAGRWQPWVSAGLMEQRVKLAVGEDRETLLHAGAGLYRGLAGPLGLRAEWRVAYSLDLEAWDHFAGLGITVAFGSDYRPDAAP